MRILWVTNQPTPQVAKKISFPIGNGGGWMNEMSRQLSKYNTLGMVFPISVNDHMQEGMAEGISYYAVPMNKAATHVDQKIVKVFIKIYENFKPDIIHIWGTEYVHSLMAVKASEKQGLIEHTIISIQGLVSIYARHFWGHIDEKVIKIPTLIDIVYNCGLNKQYRDFVKRGHFEIEALQTVKHVIGRTDWDFFCTHEINKDVKYHHCNESLRSSFYDYKWSITECEKHSIFASQSNYPIKGTHCLIEALRIIKKFYPDVHLYVTGRNRMKAGIKERMKDGRYDVYLRKQIIQYGLQDNITFVGNLDEKQMCKCFLQANVYVLPSAIENSPNSLGEAMLLGVPVVASDVGGVNNLICHNKEGYVYQSDAPYMLAGYILKYFDNDADAIEKGQNAQIHALQTHDREKNYRELIAIYESIII